MMPSNHFVLRGPLLLLPSIVPGIRVFSSESVLHIRWPKYWSFSFSISPSNEYSGLISLRLTGLISLQCKGLSRVFSSTTVQKHQFFGVQPSLWSNSHIYTRLLEKPWKYLKYFMEMLEIFEIFHGNTWNISPVPAGMMLILSVEGTRGILDGERGEGLSPLVSFLTSLLPFFLLSVLVLVQSVLSAGVCSRCDFCLIGWQHRVELSSVLSFCRWFSR